MVGKGLGSLLVSSATVYAFILFALVGLKDGVKERLLRLDLFVGNVLDNTGRLPEGLFSAFALLVDVHVGLPGVEALLALVEDHGKLQ